MIVRRKLRFCGESEFCSMFIMVRHLLIAFINVWDECIVRIKLPFPLTLQYTSIFFQKYSVKMFANEICIFIFSNFKNNKNENSILFSKCNRVFDWQIIVLVNILDQVNLIVISHQNNIGVSSWSRINIRNYTPTNITLIIFVLWNCNRYRNG